MNEKKVIVETDQVAEIAFPIPGATQNGVTAQLINVDAESGLVTTIIHIAPNARIPAHYHKNGAEAHYVLEGDFIENGIAYEAGSFFTHAANVVHGPHESKNGCRILTLQTAYVDPQNPDFHIAE